jgi:thiamine pyrophosphate-dependent acetolactate synthase large subunit-like protein
MDGFGMRVHHPSEIQGALDQAVASGKPAVVDVVSDINGIVPRSWIPS